MFREEKEDDGTGEQEEKCDGPQMTVSGDESEFDDIFFYNDLFNDQSLIIERSPLCIGISKSVGKDRCEEESREEERKDKDEEEESSSHRSREDQRREEPNTLCTCVCLRSEVKSACVPEGEQAVSRLSQRDEQRLPAGGTDGICCQVFVCVSTTCSWGGVNAHMPHRQMEGSRYTCAVLSGACQTESHVRRRRSLSDGLRGHLAQAAKGHTKQVRMVAELGFHPRIPCSEATPPFPPPPAAQWSLSRTYTT